MDPLFHPTTKEAKETMLFLCTTTRSCVSAPLVAMVIHTESARRKDMYLKVGLCWCGPVSGKEKPSSRANERQCCNCGTESEWAPCRLRRGEKDDSWFRRKNPNPPEDFYLKMKTLVEPSANTHTQE